MAPLIEQEGAIPSLGAGLEREVDLFRHRVLVKSAAGLPRVGARTNTSGKT
jgi:hypothetical protein